MILGLPKRGDQGMHYKVYLSGGGIIVLHVVGLLHHLTKRPICNSRCFKDGKAWTQLALCNYSYEIQARLPHFRLFPFSKVLCELIW